MLDQKIIISVVGKPAFTLTELYRFYFDCDENADNLFRHWQQEVHVASEVSSGLVQKI